MRKPHGIYEGIQHTDDYKSSSGYLGTMDEKKSAEYEKLVKELKKNKDVKNPWALAHHLLNKKKKESVGEVVMKEDSSSAKPFEGLVGNFFYMMKIKGVDTDALTSTLPNQLDQMKKVKNFKSNAKRGYIGAKGVDSRKAAKKWLKEFNPPQYLVSWYKDADDDSLEVFYSGVSESINEDSDKKVIDYKIWDHGIENDQYFQGHGISHTKFDDTATGIGMNSKEAFEDALDSLAQNGWNVDSIKPEAGDLGDGDVDPDSDGLYYYVSVDVKGEDEKQLGEGAEKLLGKEKMIQMAKELEFDISAALDEKGIKPVDLPEIRVIASNYSEPYVGEAKKFKYPEMMDIKIESGSNIFLTLRGDGRFIPEGAILSGKGMSKEEVIEMVCDDVAEWVSRRMKSSDKKKVGEGANPQSDDVLFKMYDSMSNDELRDELKAAQDMMKDVAKRYGEKAHEQFLWKDAANSLRIIRKVMRSGGLTESMMFEWAYRFSNKQSQIKQLKEFVKDMMNSRVENDVNNPDWDEKFVGDMVEDQLTGLHGEVNGKDTNDVFKKLTDGMDDKEINQATVEIEDLVEIRDGWAYYDGHAYKNAVNAGKTKIKPVDESSDDDFVTIYLKDKNLDQLSDVIKDLEEYYPEAKASVVAYGKTKPSAVNIYGSSKKEVLDFFNNEVKKIYGIEIKEVADQVVDEALEKWIIQDWAGNLPFGEHTFKSFDDADEFLTLFIEKKYPKTKDNEEEFSIERGEYEIVPFNGTADRSYLDPKDLRSGKKLKSEDEINAEEEDIEPDDEDIFFSDSGPLGSKTSVSAGGKNIGVFDSFEDAEKAAKEWMKKKNFYPNIWIVSDHGNYHLTSLEEDMHIKSTDTKKNMSKETIEKIDAFVKSIPNAVKYVAIPSQDKVDVFFDNVHSIEYSLKSILDGKPKAKNESIDQHVDSLMESIKKAEKLIENADVDGKQLKENDIGDDPAVYVGTYGKYNSGSIDGAWVSLNKYPTKDEFYDHIKELHKDEEDPEFMFQDYQNFPERFYGESGLSEKIWDWLELDEDDRELLEAYIDATGDKDVSIDDAKDKFQGKYDSKEDWAQEFIDQLGGLGDSAHYYLSISDLDARLIAQDEATSLAEDMRYSLKKEDYDEVFDRTDKFKEEYEALKEKLDKEEDEDNQEKIKEEIEKLAEKSIEEWESEYSDEVEQKIKDDVIGYFVDEQGAYSLEDLSKQPFISIDYEKYVRDLEINGDFNFVNKDGEYFVFMGN